MKRRRLNAGEAIWLLAAILLFVFMFVDWYGFEVVGLAEGVSFAPENGIGGNAWQTLDVVSIVLALTVLVAVGAALLRPFDSKWEPVVPLSAAVAVLGGLSTLLIGFRIVDPPDLGTFGNAPVDATRQLGAFLGFTAAAGIAYGGYRAMGERGTSFAAVADGLSSERPRPGPKRAPKQSPRPEKSASRKRRSSSSD